MTVADDQRAQVCRGRDRAAAMQRDRVDAGGQQALDRPGRGLGVGLAARLAGEAAVAVLVAPDVAHGARAGVAAASESLERGSGVVDVACATA